MAFKALTVNTPAQEAAHIYAQDDAAVFQGIFGSDGVLNIGGKMAATVVSNNKVRIGDGVLCVGGHIGRTEYSDYQDMTIENGTSGKKRNDIIYARFLTSGDTDTYSLAVKKGTAGTTATDPAVTQGNLYQGAAERDYPLWRVRIEGLSIVAVEQMYTVIQTIPDMKKQISSLQEEIATLNSNLYTELDKRVSSNNPAAIVWDTVNGSEIGIPDNGYYVVLNLIVYDNESFKEGAQLAIGYFGTSKKYYRTWANYDVTNGWTEL